MNNLRSLKLHELGVSLKNNWSDKSSILNSYLEFWTLKKRPWFIEQAVAYFPSHLNVTKCNNKRDISKTLPDLLNREPTALALYTILKDVSPSHYIAKMQQDPRYGTFTPNILAGFKLMENVPYLSWNDSSVSLCMPDTLNKIIKEARAAKALNLDLRALRAEALHGCRNETSYNFKVPTDLKGVCTQRSAAMILQLWIASPSVRSRLSILDPDDWDVGPEPLVTDKVLLPETFLPWITLN